MLELSGVVFHVGELATAVVYYRGRMNSHSALLYLRALVTTLDAISVGSSGAVMGLFGGKLAEIICRFCESTHTNQARISHQVRKEQCAAVVCSVTVVMLFSFIPYGTYFLSRTMQLCLLTMVHPYLN